MRVDTIKDVIVGSKYTEKLYFDEKTVHRFINFTNDSAGFHVDQQYSVDRGFDDLVVHGFLLSTNFSRILGMELPGENTVIASLNLEFHEPVYVGDSVEYIVTVSRVMLSLGSVMLKLIINKKNGIVCVKGSASCFFKKKKGE
jgi:acyl dehydratase